MPSSHDPNLLVGFNTADDAGVYRISDSLAVVQTVDFFPPIVDDPYQFGQIAAANALSDVYAMGGRPITALNIVAFPASKPPSILGEILRGGTEKIIEAGAVVVGGHSIKDNEMKYGVAVTGLIDPNRIVANSTARVGDRLFLTKRLGTGLVTTGIKNNRVGSELVDLVIRQMAHLNRTAGELMVTHGASAATDITGYGLMGHTFEMAIGSQMSIRLFVDSLPILPQALELAAAGMIPGGAKANREFLSGHWRSERPLDANLEHLLFDPQTSGGLLVAMPADRAEAFAAELRAAGELAAEIGRVEPQADCALILA